MINCLWICIGKLGANKYNFCFIQKVGYDTFYIQQGNLTLAFAADSSNSYI